MVEGFYFVIMKRFPYKFENFPAGILKLGASESSADFVKNADLQGFSLPEFLSQQVYVGPKNLDL